jgi:hypothetical protein
VNGVTEAAFREFLSSGDTIRVYRGDELLFVSRKAGISALLDYVAEADPGGDPVTVFDRVVGNAAALLLGLVSCREVYSPRGSDIAVKTLRQHGIGFHFAEVVPFIKNRAQTGMCPLEKLSLGKSPEEFYQACLSSGLGQGL